MAGKPWQFDEITTLELLYQARINVPDIAKVLNRTQGAIYGKLMRLDIANRRGNGGKGTGIQNFFDEIDSPLKAYLLGFLLADGWVSHERHGRCYTLHIEINKRDGEILDLFRAQIGGTIRKRPSRNSLIYSITGYDLIQSLRQYGIVPQKSCIILWPDVSIHLARYMILGYSDGDGSIYWGNKAISWSLTSGSRKFLESVREQIALGCGTELSTPKNYGGNTWQLRVQGNQKAKSVLDWLYQGHNLGISRKREIYGETLEESGTSGS